MKLIELSKEELKVRFEEYKKLEEDFSDIKWDNYSLERLLLIGKISVSSQKLAPMVQRK